MKISFIGAVAMALGVGSFIAAEGKAQAIYTEGHGDLGIEYMAGETEFEPHWHLHEGAVVDGVPLTVEGEYAPGDLAAQTTATATALTGSASWLGVAEGTAVYRLGSATYEPELGFGFEELVESDWLDASITITLTGWSNGNPGEVALLSGSAPGFQVYASTYDMGSSVNGDNSWVIDLGVGHSHPVWLLSEAGTYGLTFTWSGTYIGEGAADGGTAVSGSGTFEVQAVPEPSTWVLLSVAGVLAMVIFRRRQAANHSV